MKYKILLSACLLSLLFTKAQNNLNSAFAVVSSEKGKMEWMAIKEIDLSTGNIIRTIFDKSQTRYSLVNATTNKKLPAVEAIINGRKSASYQYPTATMVAAAAFDKRHNKLFFAPMQIGDLRWIDLYQRNGPLKVYCLSDQMFSSKELKNESNQLTRMVIAADGNGYALSNDANYFIRFTTGKKIVVTKLGKLQDDPSNKDISIHGRNAYGGDMIADASGNLYLITSNHNVFKINISKQIATHLDSIEGLPKNYSTNGAAVDRNGNLIVSSASSIEGYYKVDLATLKAERLNTQNQVFSCSDLATGHLALQNNETSTLLERTIDLNSKQVSVYPNPVTRGFFKVNFNNLEAGRYDIQLMNLSGQVISQKRVNVNMKGQTENVTVSSKYSKGIYLVKIVNGSKKTISSGKILLQ